MGLCLSSPFITSSPFVEAVEESYERSTSFFGVRFAIVLVRAPLGYELAHMVTQAALVMKEPNPLYNIFGHELERC